MNKISENIKKKRLEKNLTQQEVADKLYVTRQCISRWEQGLTLPDIYCIEKLAEVFNCNPNEIIDNDAIKMITIDEAIKNKKSKKVIMTSILISVLAILLSLFAILLIIKNKNGKNLDIHYLNAMVLTMNSEEIQFKLDKFDVPEDQSRDFTLPLKDSSHIKIYDTFQTQMDLSKLKLNDIVQISYYEELHAKNIKEIHLLDSEVEKSFHGVILIANGQRYETLEDIPTDSTQGVRFYLYQQDWNSSNTIQNAGAFEVNVNATYDWLNSNMINRKNEVEMNIYFDSKKMSNELVIGLVYSTGIEYVETLDKNYSTRREYEGELGYELPDGLYVSHSIDFKFNINIENLSSFNKLEVYEYDMNHELIKVSTLYDWDDLFDFKANKDSIYAYFKEYYYHYGAYETYKTYMLNVGDEVTIPIVDDYGMVRKEKFFYRFKG